ncbi:MAG: zf-HC2 domain-containing protein, partial [Sedimentisphaerales bacterium]
MNSQCENIQDQATDYVLGILDEDEIELLEEHIEQCSECKEHLENLQKERETLLQLGEIINSKMDEREESVIAALEKVSNKQSIKSTLFNSRAFRFAAAAVIAIALLIPLSYGANNLIKRLVAGSVQYDDFQGDFFYDEDIYIDLKVGNKEQKEIINTENIRFFIEDGELRGTLRCYVGNLPKIKWMTVIQLVDSQDKKLASTEHINENSAIEESSFPLGSFRHSIHFTLGKWEDLANAEKFTVSIKEVSGDKQITPDAWSKSDKLAIVQGWVTGHDGKPVA